METSFIIIIIYVIGFVKSNSYIAFSSFRFGYRFNETAPITNRDYFLTHLRSISTFKNTTFLYFTDYIETKIPFPSNAIQIQIEWVDLITKLELFVGASFPALKKSSYYYKLCDFKPLLALLYPGHFREYEWVGWLDNDAWFSSELEKYIIHSSKKGYSQISFYRDHNRFSLGPISIFTWDFYITYINAELKKEQNRQLLIKVLNDTVYKLFDEWGNKGTYQHSFSRILLDIYKDNRHLKILDIPKLIEKREIGLGYDVPCLKIKDVTSKCGYCRLMIKNGETLLYLNIEENAKESFNLWKGHFMCHFQYGKKMHPTNSLSIFNNSVIMSLIFQEEVLINSTYHQGMQFVTV